MDSRVEIGDVLIISRVYEHSFVMLRIMVESFPQLSEQQQTDFRNQLTFGGINADNSGEKYARDI